MAHDQSGALGSAVGATDMYLVTCEDGEDGSTSEHLYLEVIDYLPKAAPLLSVQIFKGGVALNATDPIDGDKVYSPELKFNGGNGGYLVIINKSAAGAEKYGIVYHCESKTGSHTGTTIYPYQNQ